MLDDPVDRPGRSARREGVGGAHDVAAPARIRRDARIGGEVQRHEFQPQQEVIVGGTAVRRVGDRREGEPHRQAGAVGRGRGGRGRIGVRDRQPGTDVGRELRPAGRNLEFVAAARISQAGVGVAADPVDAGGHDVVQDQVAHHALRQVDADLVDEALADRPVVGKAVQGVGLRRGNKGLGQVAERARCHGHLGRCHIVVQPADAVRPRALVAVRGGRVERNIRHLRPVGHRRSHKLVGHQD